MQCSPIKFSPEGTPQIVMLAMLKEPITTSPSMKLQFKSASGLAQQVEFRLPLFLNKFTEPVEMPSADVFIKTWDDITHVRPTSFQKIDVIFKNPAPAHVPYTEVLNKAANFFRNGMNLKVF